MKLTTPSSKTHLIVHYLNVNTCIYVYFVIFFFILTDVIRIWDSLLSDEERPQFLICVCCAMIL